MKPVNVPTIPLKAAKARVARFREQFKAVVAEPSTPRAILIPINDLMAIIEKYSAIDEDGNVTNSLSGVRAYFAVKLTDESKPDDVTALVVAVDKDGKDIIPVGDGLEDGPDSEIYDFTKPCPDVCDPTSPLFIP
jgi:hypothetical protein